MSRLHKHSSTREFDIRRVLSVLQKCRHKNPNHCISICLLIVISDWGFYYSVSMVNCDSCAVMCKRIREAKLFLIYNNDCAIYIL